MGLDHVLGWEVHHLQTPAGPNDFPDSIKYLNYIDHTMCQQPPLRSQGLLSQPLDMWCLEMPCHRMLPWQACWPQPPRSCRQLLLPPRCTYAWMLRAGRWSDQGLKAFSERNGEMCLHGTHNTQVAQSGCSPTTVQ